MSDEKQPPQPNLREPELVISTPPEIATSLPSEIAEQTEDENKLVGTVVMDRYLVQSIAGRGGMSVVYKSQHLLLKRPIALKTLHKQLSNQAKHIQRFKVEAQAASRLSHENIVSVYDFGVLTNDCAFLAMEYVEGRQLAEIIHKERHFQLERAIELTIQCCSALQHAHDNGVVHRDLKPSNVIITHKDKGVEAVKIVDFGIAKVWEDDQQLTRTGETVGSPPYMSPEQCRGDENLDARSDIYSLGCLFYEMLCGKAPLTGGTVYETIHKQINEMPRSISHTRDDIKAVAEVDDVLLKALSKNPDARYQSMEEFKEALIKLRTQVQGNQSIADKLSTKVSVLSRRYLAGRQGNYKPLKTALLCLAVCAAAVGGLNYWQTHVAKAPSGNPPAIELQMPDTGESYEKTFDTQMQVARGLMDRGKPAIDELEAASTAALTAFGEQDGRYLRALKFLKSEYSLANREKEAQAVQSEIQRIDRFLIPLGDPLGNSARIQDLIMKQQSDPTNKTIAHDLIVTLTNQAQILRLAGRHEESKKDALQAIFLAEKYFPGDSLSIRSRIILAGELRSEGRRDLASLEYKKIASLGEQAKSTEAVQGLAAYALAEDDYYANRTADALRRHREAIQHFRNFYGGPSPQEADATEGLAKTLAATGDFAGAEKNMLAAIEMSRTVEGPRNITLGKRTLNLGWIYMKSKNWPKAESTLKQAMDILYRNSLGDSLSMARAAAQLGHVYYFQNKFDLAEPYLKQAIVLFARNDRHEQEEYWKSLPEEFRESAHRLLDIYSKQKRYKDITKLNELVKKARFEAQFKQQ